MGVVMSSQNLYATTLSCHAPDQEYDLLTDIPKDLFCETTVFMVIQSRCPFFGDRYDWTTGAPHDGTYWKKYRVVPRAHPSRTLLYAHFNRSRSKGAFSFPGATWDRFRCTVEISPGHIRCRFVFLRSLVSLNNYENRALR